ncbi:MAG: hypothetical protein RIQ38_2966 [Pseudomonadota bacterium]
MSPVWQTRRFVLNLQRPQVMGIVNATPDSFSDGGRFLDPRAALAQAQRLLDDGADLLDIGAESTRPGAAAVTPEAEWARLAPVLEELVRWQVPLSVDTRHALVMRRALAMGVDIINDVQALQGEGALAAVAEHPGCGVCLMHMHREPGQMQQQPLQGDAVPQVVQALAQAAQAVRAAGVAPSCVVLDPGIGFGKTPEQNLALLAHTDALLALGYPVLAGWSRKSTLGVVAGAPGQPLPVAERLSASLAAALLSVERGARIVRVHDVRETVQVLRVWQAERSLRSRI